MGKTGPLYEFDAAGDVRIRQDAALDCGEAHPAKVVLTFSSITFVFSILLKELELPGLLLSNSSQVLGLMSVVLNSI